jgi:hypothetical protein
MQDLAPNFDIPNSLFLGQYSIFLTLHVIQYLITLGIKLIV